MSLIVLTWCIDRWRSDVTFGTVSPGLEWVGSVFVKPSTISVQLSLSYYLKTKCSKQFMCQLLYYMSCLYNILCTSC